jgi:hypothetical protein
MSPDTVPPTFTSEAVDWSDIGYQMAHGATKRISESDVQKHVVSALTEKAGAVQAVVMDVIVDIALRLGHGLHALEAPFLPVVAAFTAPIVQGLFGAEVSEDMFARRIVQGGGAAAGQSIVRGLFSAISGEGGGPLVPGVEGAQRIAGAAVAASLESTFNAMVPELLSDIFPEFGHFEAFTELPENIIRTLGVSRLVRRAIGPLVSATCTTPLQWHVNKTYRPELLSPSLLAGQVARGTYTREEAIDELALQGYAPRRIDALLSQGLKLHSASDLDLLVRAGHMPAEAALDHLRAGGWLEPQAREELLLEKLRRIASFERAMAGAAVDAFVAGRIGEGELGGFIQGTTIDAQERGSTSSSRTPARSSRRSRSRRVKPSGACAPKC